MTLSMTTERIGIAALITSSCVASVWISTADLPAPPVEVAPARDAGKNEDSKADTRPALRLAWNPETLSSRFQGPPKPEEPVKLVVAVAPVVTLPPIPLQLTGTILEDGNRFAVLRDNSGQEFVVREGEQVPVPHTTITVKSVTERSAKFSISGTEQELTLKAPNFESLFP